MKTEISEGDWSSPDVWRDQEKTDLLQKRDQWKVENGFDNEWRFLLWVVVKGYGDEDPLASEAECSCIYALTKSILGQRESFINRKDWN